MTRYLCTFVLSKDGEKDPPLRCRIKWDGSRSIVSFNLGFRINPERWDSKVQLCAVNSFHGPHRTPASVINREIRRYREACDAVFLRIGDEWPTVDRVRTELRVELGLDERRDVGVLDALAEFVRTESVRVSWSSSTAAKFRQLQTHLKTWNEAPTWESFRTDGLTEFLGSLRREGLRNDTTERQLRFLKWFLRWAVMRHYTDITDFEEFRPKLTTTEKRVIFLTWDELMSVWNYQAGSGFKALVRDFFCFCAFSGLRFSDAMALRWSDVERDCIRVTTKKTADSLTIELNRWTDEILGRYVDVPVSGDYVFPRATNQAMNRTLKEICRELGLNEPVRVTWYRGPDRIDEIHPKYELIGTHCARRTFICNCLMMGIAPNVVMKWTGHSDYSAMKPYIDITDDAKAKAMNLFNDKR